jgi:ATP-dependent Clp protease ATP-binding subunit ClpC
VFERFTDRARRVLVLAQEEARLLNHDFIGTEHILLGLIHETDGVAAKALEQMGIELEDVRAKVEETIGASVLAGGMSTGSPPFTPRAKKVLELALREALQLGHNYIGTEHLLLGIVREGEGVAVQVLTSLGADPARVRQEVLDLLRSLGTPGGPDYPPSERAHGRSGRIVACSFCGRQSPEAGRLISGQGAYICEHCVREWSDQLARDEDADDE